MNLVQSILDTMGDEVLGKLSGALGAGKDETQTAVQAAVPALLASLGSVASKPEGAEKVWSAVQGVDDSIIGNLRDMMGGDKPSIMQQMGTGILEGIFGKGILSSLIGALAGFLGGKTNLIGKLLPMLAPVVMGMLSKQVKSGGLDLGGLVKLLLGQKENVARSMPSGLASALTGVQGLGDLSGFLPSGAATSKPAVASTTHATKQSSPMSWLLPLIAVLAIGGLVWSMMNRGRDAVEDVDKAIENAGVELGGAAANVGELTTNFKDVFGNMSDLLGNVTDVASAEQALPKLQEINAKLDTLSTTYRSVPESARGGIVTMIREALATLAEKKDAVLAIPGVGNLLRPVLDDIFEKVDSLLPA